jgi:hypothetical protein
MALFGGRDRSGGTVDFKGDGSASAFILQVAVVTAIPTPLGHDSGAATTTAQTLSAAGVTVPANATHMRVDVEAGGGDLIYTIDGSTTPTTTLGEVIPAGQAGEIALADLSDVKVLASTGTVDFSCSFRRYDA